MIVVPLLGHCIVTRGYGCGAFLEPVPPHECIVDLASCITLSALLISPVYRTVDLMSFASAQAQPNPLESLVCLEVDLDSPVVTEIELGSPVELDITVDLDSPVTLEVELPSPIC